MPSPQLPLVLWPLLCPFQKRQMAHYGIVGASPPHGSASARVLLNTCPPPSINADGSCPFSSLLLHSPDLGNKCYVPILRSFGTSVRIWVSSASHCASGAVSTNCVKTHLRASSGRPKLSHTEGSTQRGEWPWSHSCSVLAET